MDRVLITGADGFIGSHLTEAMVREGYHVRCLVLYNSMNTWGWLDECASDTKGHFEVYSGDVRDPSSVKEAMADCDGVMHLAALIAIPYSYRSPRSYVDTNVCGTLNVVEAARELGIGKVVHTSTSEVYGTAQFIPITEDHPLHAQSPYSASKIAADQIALSFHHSFHTPVTILRPFNTYGPRQSARAIIPTIITQIASGRSQIELGSLHPTRDFSYVSDTVTGFIRAFESDETTGRVLNLGSGFEISVRDVVTAISELMDKDVAVLTRQERLRPVGSEVERLYASHDQATATMQWKPQFAGMEGFRRGLEPTIDWFSRPENLRRYRTGIFNL